MPAAGWPRCAECGSALTHVLTLHHDETRLPLGAPDRWLSAFMCEHDPGMCDTWAPDTGANLCVVLDDTTSTPWTSATPDDEWAYPDLRVASWLEGDAQRWDFVAQVQDWWPVDGLPPEDGELNVTVYDERSAQAPATSRVGALIRDREWGVCAANFGNGTAFFFVDRHSDPPAAIMLWQR